MWKMPKMGKLSPLRGERILTLPTLHAQPARALSPIKRGRSPRKIFGFRAGHPKKMPPAGGLFKELFVVYSWLYHFNQGLKSQQIKREAELTSLSTTHQCLTPFKARTHIHSNSRSSTKHELSKRIVRTIAESFTESVKTSPHSNCIANAITA